MEPEVAAANSVGSEPVAKENLPVAPEDSKPAGKDESAPEVKAEEGVGVAVAKGADPRSQEKEQEALLKKKYPGFKPGGGSALLHKRLNKEPKYFDSGDYNMAKAKLLQKPSVQQANLLTESTGGKIPTPENVPPRKAPPPSLQSKLTATQ